jgi:hypothetical protein
MDMMDLNATLGKPLTVVVVASIIGLLIRRIRFRNVHIGSSGALASGLVFGYLGFSTQGILRADPDSLSVRRRVFGIDNPRDGTDVKWLVLQILLTAARRATGTSTYL